MIAVGDCINISVYNPLLESFNIKLPIKLRNTKKGLINIISKDNKCFLWGYVRHLNPVDKNSQRIANLDRQMVNNLIYDSLKISVLEKIMIRLYTFIYISNSFFWSGLWLFKLENHLRSQVV